MNVTCSAQGCPILLNSLCVIYEGESLLYTGITTNDTLQTALQKIDAKFHDAGLGYLFTNGLTQIVGQPVKLGGTLIENTTITNNSYYLQFTGTVKAATFVTTGGTNLQFVKGDGSLDNTSYQTAGAYITALSGDASATGPGNAIVTLATVNTNVGTFGTATTVPTITVNEKGLVTSVTSTAINIPWPLLTYTGDISGVGYPGTQITLTLPSVNPNAITSSGILKLTVNNKGLVTSAVAASSLDLFGLMGFTPVPPTRTITINGVTQDLGVNRSWNVGTVTSVNATAGTSIGVSVTDPTGAPNITITNLAPDVPITLTPGFGINVTGIYPNFTIINTNPSTSGGTVTSVNMTVPTGFTISGNPITSSGTFALAMASGYSIPTTVSQTNWNTAYTFVNNFPSQSGNVGKYLTTDGSNLSWATVTGGISGSGTAGQITYWSGTSAVTGSSSLTFSNNGFIINTNISTSLYKIFQAINTFDTQVDIKTQGTNNAALCSLSSGDGTTSGRYAYFMLQSLETTPQRWDIGLRGNKNLVYYNSTLNSAALSINSSTNNVLINTTTDGGQRLQVIGSMRVGTTAASAMYWDDTNNRLGIGTSSPTNIGVINAVQSINGFMGVSLKNTSSGTSAQCGYYLENNVGGLSVYFKQSSTATTYKNIAANDVGFYNTTNGNISLLNDNSSGNINFAAGASSTAHMTISSTGNVGIGTSSPSATLNIVGAGNTSATTALTVQNSDATGILRVRNDNKVLLSQLGFGNDFPEIFSTVSGAYDVNGGSLSFNSSQANYGVSSYNFYFRHVYSGKVFTSGTGGGILQDIGFSPTSGTGIFNQVALIGAINQTGGANGITRGLYINPTLTSAADFRAIETTAGNVLFGSNFFWDNTNGRLGIGTNIPGNYKVYINHNSSGPDNYNYSGLIVNGNQSNIYIKSGDYTGGNGDAAFYLGNSSGIISSLIVSGNASNANAIIYFKYGTTSTYMTYGPNDYNKFRIGTTAPPSTYKQAVITSFGRADLPVLSVYGATSQTGSLLDVYANNDDNTRQLRIFSNGDVVMQNGGTFTDGGQRLQVIGSMRVGTTAASAMYWDDTNNRLGIGTSSPGVILDIVNNQNSETALYIRNTTSGTSSVASIYCTSNSTAGSVQYGKQSSTKTTYKILSPSDGYLYNSTAGDIAILNDFASGNIKFAAGGSSTAHMTIKSNGRINMSSLPTSSAGLSAGDLWNNLGIVSIV